MKKLFLLLLFCHVSSPVKHSLTYLFTASSGVPNFPEFVGVALVDEIQVGYCDTNKVEPNNDWGKQMFSNEPDQLEFYTRQCNEIQPNVCKARIYNLKQRFNQSDDIHILQRMGGCEWNENTGEVVGILQYGYDGEDFISLDLKTLTWIAPKQQALLIKQRWEAEKARIKRNENFFTQICPAWLRKYLEYGKNSLLRTELPSVSLLQKTPSSPVSCHATGFYPDRAAMFWRKGEEELREGVDQGETLPNPDGTFQMSVDLKLSSVAPEDWGMYECVFQLSGVEKDIVTKLDKAVIRTNRVKPSIMTISIIVAVAVVIPVVTTVVGFFVHKKKKAPDNSSEFSERLNSET